MCSSQVSAFSSSSGPQFFLILFWVSASTGFSVYNLWLLEGAGPFCTQRNIPQTEQNHLRAQPCVRKHKPYLFSMSRIIKSSTMKINMYLGLKEKNQIQTQKQQKSGSTPNSSLMQPPTPPLALGMALSGRGLCRDVLSDPGGVQVHGQKGHPPPSVFLE